jgi:hypothetical protein
MKFTNLFPIRGIIEREHSERGDNSGGVYAEQAEPKHETVTFPDPLRAEPTVI